MPSPPKSPALRVRRAQERAARRQREAHEAMLARDREIVAAHGTLSLRNIARLTGMSTSRVHQVVRDAE